MIHNDGGRIRRSWFSRILTAVLVAAGVLREKISHRQSGQDPNESDRVRRSAGNPQ